MPHDHLSPSLVALSAAVTAAVVLACTPPQQSDSQRTTGLPAPPAIEAETNLPEPGQRHIQ